MEEDKKIQRSIEVRIGVQKALLGAILPNLRAVFCDWNDQEINLHFVFNEKIDQKAQKQVNIVKERMYSLFPANNITAEAVHVDFPKTYPNFGARLLYSRKEIIPEEPNEEKN